MSGMIQHEQISVGISGLRDRSVHKYYIMAPSCWHAVDALSVNKHDLKHNCTCANIQDGNNQKDSQIIPICNIICVQAILPVQICQNIHVS